jgi:hypothetical protein
MCFSLNYLVIFLEYNSGIDRDHRSRFVGNLSAGYTLILSARSPVHLPYKEST